MWSLWTMEPSQSPPSCSTWGGIAEASTAAEERAEEERGGEALSRERASRADLFAGKAKSWIRLYVFDAFPEVQIENGNPKAWVVGAHGTGKVTKIYLPYARAWMHDNHDRINWLGKEVR